MERQMDLDWNSGDLEKKYEMDKGQKKNWPNCTLNVIHLTSHLLQSNDQLRR